MERIDLMEELKKIRARGAEVSSTMIVKTKTLRIVLMAGRAGAGGRDAGSGHGRNSKKTGGAGTAGGGAARRKSERGEVAGRPWECPLPDSDSRFRTLCAVCRYKLFNLFMGLGWAVFGLQNAVECECR